MPSILQGIQTSRDNIHIIFIHGSNSSPQGNWFPYVSSQLNDIGISHSIPSMPNPEHPDAIEWVERLEQEVQNYKDRKIILIGHSRGTRTIQLYLQESQEYFEQIILIATWGNHPDNYQYTKTSSHKELWAEDVDYQKIKSKSKQFVIVHSVDDKALPFYHARNCAKALDAELITTQGRGHLADPRNGDFILQIILRFQTPS